MRRIAASRMFIAGKPDALVRHIAEIVDEGRMVNHYALSAELAMTEWLGGVLLASPCSECDITHPKTLDEVMEALDMSNTDTRCWYVWHLSRVNIETMELQPDCVFQRLEDEDDDDF